MTLKATLMGAVAGTALLANAAAADELNVAYFLEWPMPFQAAKVSGAYDKALGHESKLGVF